MPSQAQFADTYRGKRVLVTGDTGFKGSWLSLWLHELGAHVVGLADSVPTNPSLFEEAGLSRLIDHVFGDIRDFEAVQRLIQKTQPDFVFHLAAQSLVRRAYLEPRNTFQTNTMGTLNVLECLKETKHPCVLVSITSDKAYDNVEWVWGYRETDALGGKDPYSGSKAAAELVLKSYYNSYFAAAEANIRIGIGRAGNVIGGGDWAEDRIVPDAARAWSLIQMLEVRSPNATRPWQHVLEPLSGYLTLGANLFHSRTPSGEAFNFGPSSDQIYTVRELLEAMSSHWSGACWKDLSASPSNASEARLLKLNCDKALHLLKWQPTLTFPETVQFTVNWYRDYYRERSRALEISREQIVNYNELARARGIQWAVSK